MYAWYYELMFPSIIYIWKLSWLTRLVLFISYFLLPNPICCNIVYLRMPCVKFPELDFFCIIYYQSRIISRTRGTSFALTRQCTALFKAEEQWALYQQGTWPIQSISSGTSPFKWKFTRYLFFHWIGYYVIWQSCFKRTFLPSFLSEARPTAATTCHLKSSSICGCFVTENKITLQCKLIYLFYRIFILPYFPQVRVIYN